MKVNTSVQKDNKVFLLIFWQVLVNPPIGTIQNKKENNINEETNYIESVDVIFIALDKKVRICEEQGVKLNNLFIIVVFY